MKTLYFILLIIFFFGSCEIKKQSSDEKKSLSTKDLLNDHKIISKYSEKLQRIFINDKGIIRGVSLGDKFSDVQSKMDTTEIKIKPAEGKFKFVTSLNNYEDVDIIFFFNNDEVITEIGIDPYLNTQQSVDSLSHEMTQYFIEKYGNIFKKDSNKTIGDNKNLHFVIEDVSIKTVPGLQIRITKK